LQSAEKEIREYLATLAAEEGVTITSRQLARFEPVEFDERVVRIVETLAQQFGHTAMRLPSGAGHDAQMLARMCPTGMIFVPSIKGISHNPAEDTSDDDLEAGANLLLHTMLQLTDMEAP
jgi:N-carbamoyl-L-amino-acid hydrolase